MRSESDGKRNPSWYTTKKIHEFRLPRSGQSNPRSVIHPRRLYLRLEQPGQIQARPDRAGLTTAAHCIDPVDRARGLRVRRTGMHALSSK